MAIPSCPTVQSTIAADDLLYALALASLPGVGPVTARQRLSGGGDAQAAFHDAVVALDGDGSRRSHPSGTSTEGARALRDARAILHECEQRGVDVIPLTSERYPASLRDLEDAPAVLYILGSLATTVPPAVALVGARRATAYGRLIVRDFARRLASRGVCVVSGLAMGIDAEAHAAALAAGGPTIAVQGTGVDVAYPRSNTALHAQIARDGLVVSELPPGHPAHPGAFPRRNRLIAALSDLVVVVEAGARSGALITAQLGGSLGRLVAAVPGPIDADSSAGANQLLRDGGHVVASFDDVLGLLALTRRGRATSGPGGAGDPGDPGGAPSSGSRPLTAFPPESPEGRVIAVLSHGPQGADDLIRACGISPRQVGTALATLELRGVVSMDPAGLARLTHLR